MIRFLRHIRQSLLAENKFSRYLAYAFGEIVLVVLGILIALQINTWNLHRMDREREINYLKNIRLDLQKDLESLDYNLDFRRRKAAGMDKLLSQMNGAPIDDINELTFNIVNTVWSERFQPSNTTFKEIVSSGNVNLIHNDSIRTLLLEMELDYLVNTFFIEHETFDYQEYLSKPVFQSVDLEHLAPVFQGNTTAEAQGIRTEMFHSLLGNQAYKNGCYVEVWSSAAIISLYEQILTRSTTIIDLIDRDIHP